eukprot:PITA_35514
MCLMNSALHSYLEKFVIVFIDDILVYSKNGEEYVEHLATVLRFLREHQWYANLSNCSFFQTEVHHLGHVVSKDDIALDPEKIRAIMEWAAPKNEDERKGKKFEWTEECEASVEQLKQWLTHAPVLKIVDPDKEFLVCTDACKRGLGGVFMQGEQVVCYESRKLNEHEQNYPTNHLELAAIIHAMKVWRHYLLGRRSTLMSDHIGLRYLFDQTNLNAKQARWLAILSKFDFEIKYIKGKENRVADTLSRKAQVNHIAVMRSYGTELQDRIFVGRTTG